MKTLTRILTLICLFNLNIITWANAGTGRARFSWEAVADPIVSGYKVHWGTASRVYTHTVDAGNVTEIIVAAFAEGVTYYSAISAYADTGEESDYSIELSFIYDSTDRLIFLEAEDGVLTAPMQAYTDSVISWVKSVPTDPNASTTLNFTTPYSCDFYVWCRILAPSSNSNTLNVTVNDGTTHVYYVYGQSTPPPEAYQSNWIWSLIQFSPGVGRAFALTGGAHTIKFHNCGESLIDRLVISSCPDFVPTDALPRSGDFMEFVTQPQSKKVPIGESAIFSATIVSTGYISMEWLHNGVAIPDSSQTILNLSNVQISDSGSYFLSVWKNLTTISTNPVSLNVYTPLSKPKQLGVIRIQTP